MTQNPSPQSHILRISERTVNLFHITFYKEVFRLPSTALKSSLKVSKQYSSHKPSLDKSFKIFNEGELILYLKRKYVNS